MATSLKIGLERTLPAGTHGMGDVLFAARFASNESYAAANAVISRTGGGTLVNAAGEVVFAPENANPGPVSGGSWGKVAVATVTGNNTTGYVITADGTNAFHYVSCTAYSAAQQQGWERIEFDAKTNSGNARVWAGTQSTGGGITFDLVNGVVSAGHTPGTREGYITALGDGWYRCVVKYNRPTAGVVYPILLVANSAGTTLFTGAGESILVKRVKVARGLEVDDFALTAETPTYAPRITYDPVTGECLGLICEDQVTNIWPDSNFASSSLVRGTIALLTQTKFPSAYRFTVNDATAAAYVWRSVTVTSGQRYRCSIYVKGGTVADGKVGWYQFGANSTQTINFTTGTLTGSDSGNMTNTLLIPVGGGWYRMECTWTASASGAQNLAFVCGNLSAVGQYVDIAEIQVEAINDNATRASSLMPTRGATVIRAADEAYVILPTINSEDFSVDVDFITQDNDAVRAVWQLDDNTDANRVVANMSGSISFVGGSGSLSIGTATPGTPYSITSGLKDGDSATTNTAGGLATSAATNATAGLTYFRIGKDRNATAHLNGTIAKIAVYKKRLPNDRLQALSAD